VVVANGHQCKHKQACSMAYSSLMLILLGFAIPVVATTTRSTTTTAATTTAATTTPATSVETLPNAGQCFADSDCL